MPKDNPKVSVIMPAYNGASFINGSINSVLSQTFKDFELIIINDGSTDRTGEIIKSCSDARIAYLENKKNQGVPKARNRGLKFARGEYIAYCDHDDIYYPDHLKVLAGFLDNHPRIGLVYADSLVRFHNSAKTWVMHSEDFDKNKLEIYNFLNPSEVMHRKECLKKSGLFDENKVIKECSCEDWDLWLRISDHFQCRHIKKILGELVFYKTNRTFTVKYSISMEYVFTKRLNRFRGRQQKIEYVRNCSIGIVSNLLLLYGNFEGAYRVAKRFYSLARTAHSSGCMGMVYSAMGNFRAAVKYFKKCFKEYCPPTEDFFKLKISASKAFSSAGFFYEAEKQLLDAKALMPQNKELIEHLALLYIKYGWYDKALKLSRRCEPLRANNIKGLCYFKKGSYKKAVSEFKRSIKLNKNTAKIPLNIWDREIHRKERSLDLARTYYNLGISYIKINRPDFLIT